MKHLAILIFGISFFVISCGKGNHSASGSQDIEPKAISDSLVQDDVTIVDTVEPSKLHTVALTDLEGLAFTGLDFALDEVLSRKFKFNIIDPARHRYGLYEFDKVEQTFQNKNDTVFGIIMHNWPVYTFPVYYCFWNAIDTVTPHKRYQIKNGWNSPTELKISIDSNTLPCRLLSNNKIDSLPDFYRIPVDSGGYRSIALKLIFRDGLIKQAEATPFYNAAITDVKYRK